VWKVDYWVHIVTFKTTNRWRQFFVTGRKPLLSALNINVSAQNLQQSIINLYKNMSEAIYCGKRSVWLLTRPRYIAIWAIKWIVTSRECNYHNGFKHSTNHLSCICSRWCWLLCLCIGIAHRNSTVPWERRRIRHCRSSCVVERNSPFIETYMDIPWTYHWFSLGHEVNFIHDVKLNHMACRLYKIRFRR